MSYQFTSRVRYSEVGPDKKLTLPGMLDYFQDCCTFQSASIGHTLEDLEARERVWVLNAWQVEICRYPRIGEGIVTTTLPYDLKGFYGLRNFVMETEEGERLAYANSIWSNINMKTGIPERLTEEDTSGYVLDERLEMEYAPRKIALPEEWEAYPSFPVQSHHLDTHLHVNNCQYVRMALDYLDGEEKVRSLRVEYKKMALLGDVFYPLVHKEKETETSGQQTYVAFGTHALLPGEKPEAYAAVWMRTGGETG